MLVVRRLARPPVFSTFVRSMAVGKKTTDEDPTGVPSEIKKRLKSWVEQILTSTPQPVEIPEHLVGKEEQFLKEVNARFDMRQRERTKAEQAKITLKLRAIDAMPAEMKKEAQVMDYSLWPLTIPMPTTTPPTKEWILDHYRIVEMENVYVASD